VASDIFGVSGRAMLAALVAGERDPKVLAQLARQRLRAKLGLLEEAFCGHFSDHHAFLLATMLERIDRTSADIAAVEAKLEAEIAPFQAAVDRLDESPASAAPPRGSSSPRSAPTWAASPWASGLLGSVRARRQGIGRQDQGQGHHRPRQPLPGQGPGGGRRGRGQDQHLPGRALPAHRAAPRRQAGRGGGRPLHPDHHLAPALGPDRPLPRSWPGFYDTRIDADRKRRNHVRQLEALGYKVTLEPAA